MRRTASMTDVSRHLSDYINRVAYKGEQFVVIRGKQPLAELRAVPRGRRLGELPELMAALPHLPAPEATAFHQDLVRSRRRLAKRSIRDPWAS